ncbi:MAG: hypothetical protein OCC45_06305 [Desulfotalea sp.]
MKLTIRKRIKKLAILTTIAFCVAHISNAYANDTVTILNAEEVRILYTGKTITILNNSKKEETIITYKDIGIFRGTTKGGKYKITGKWEVKEDGTLCTKRNKNKAKMKCVYVVKDGDQYLTLRVTSKFKVN